MNLKFVIFRFQPDLTKDEWLPLGVVVECTAGDEPEIGVMYVSSVEGLGGSELAATMLQDVPAILNNEVQNTRARLRPDDDFLEVLRAHNPWNFHFTTPEQTKSSAETLQQATMELFYRYVLQIPKPKEPKPKRERPKAIRPRRMEAYEVLV